MFNKLIASEGRGRRFWSPRTVTVSVAIHALLVAGAVYASVAMPEKVEKEEEEVTFMEIEEKQPEASKPVEPPPPPPQVTSAPPPPKGFQELVPPDVAPPEIPEPDLSEAAVSAEDFSGVGVAGGTATGVEGGTPQNAVGVDSTSYAYEVAVLETKPKLSNINQVQGILQRLYPRMLQNAGIEGSVMMQFVITAEGEVDPTSVKVISTSHDQFGSASTEAVERFRFTPGRYRGQAVRVLIQMPITWKQTR